MLFHVRSSSSFQVCITLLNNYLRPVSSHYKEYLLSEPIQQQTRAEVLLVISTEGGDTLAEANESVINEVPTSNQNNSRKNNNPSDNGSQEMRNEHC